MTGPAISDTMPDGMRVLCILNGGPDHPSTRFRLLQHLGVLRRRGLEPDLVVAKRDAGYGILSLRRRAATADVVLVQKKLFPSWKLSLLPRRVPLVFDFDDAVFEVSPDEAERFGADRAAKRAGSRRRRLRAVLRRARTVIAGNSFLAGYASGVAARVATLPTGVDLAPFPEQSVRSAAARREASSDVRTIGWIGSRPSLRYLAGLAGPLREVCARVPGARLVQVCDAFIDIPGVPIETRPWDARREAADLLGFDVGLMPIDDGSFARGKCGLKILQYQAAGVPVVCSPVGANLDIVRPGETGLFARTEGEWAAAIAALLGDHGLARRLGNAGRARVREVYAAPIIGGRLADLILAAASGERRLPGEEAERHDKTGQDERLLVPDHLSERPGRALAGERMQ